MFSEVVSSRTADVIVSVQTAYLPGQSNPELESYTFAYRIRITNESTEPVQLVRRAWLITDGVGRKRKVEGEGVVGQKPVLLPGQSHEYVSGCEFKTCIGNMRGYYVMTHPSDREQEFKVRIPSFTMATPHTLN